ncbi:MAG: DUF4153 domain-containing protein [Cyclobacteriaceae bacterium]
MKKIDYLILATVGAYSYLFYQQSPGINHLIFTVILLLVLLITESRRVRALPWLTVALGALASGFNITLQHTNLALAANIISLVALAGLSFQPKSSLLIAGINGLYSFGVSLAQNWYYRLALPSSGKHRTRFRWRPLVSVVIPILVTMLFLWLYRMSSPVFENLVSKISFQFISWDWIGFTAVGWVVIFGFIQQKGLSTLVTADQQASDGLMRKRNKVKRSKPNLSLKYEFKTGLLLLLLLNLLLFAFNSIDAISLFTKRLPAHLTYSQYVHQGIITLIVSIVLAVIIILYFFRGNLNFFSGNRRLLWLAYFWILQNLLLVYTTAYKNFLYISEYGLTHKRIGVYVYLSLTFFGLLTTFIKVFATKSNWFLFRKNAWLFYLAMIVCTFFNWDRIITEYNLSKSKRTDIDYLIGLSTSNLLHLHKLSVEHPEKLTYTQQHAINYELDQFKLKTLNRNWQSWNYREHQLRDSLFTQSENKIIQ